MSTLYSHMFMSEQLFHEVLIVGFVHTYMYAHNMQDFI